MLIYVYIHLCVCMFINTYRNTTQHNATHRTTTLMEEHNAHCNTLQHTAAHCSTLQHTATHGSTRQHTATHRTVTVLEEHDAHAPTIDTQTTPFANPLNCTSPPSACTLGMIWRKGNAENIRERGMHEVFVCATWLIHKCGVTYAYVSRD